ncbi:MAG: 3-methyl-2-oxobutanoate dehydrogenase subunit VorB [Clostridiales bacterium]
MKEKLLMKGNEVIAEAAIRAGCRYYFGYPITPQTEISHYMAKKIPELGGVFLQAESEIAAINMVYGTASTGKRVMTSSSSPGISLKQEGLSYMAGAELPAVVVNIVRCGPGLGGILPSQGDYFQSVKGGGHGDYKMIVYAPFSIQELYELTVKAFDVADKYRIVSMIMGDGILGQMMESIEFKEEEKIINYDKSWATTGTEMKRERNIITSIHLDPNVLESLNNRLFKKYKIIEEEEYMAEEYNCDNADIIIVAYGTVARIAESIVKEEEFGKFKVGLIRPITLWPFPSKILKKYNPKAFLTVEMSLGQMVEDVKLSVNDRDKVLFYGRTGGNIPTHKDIVNEIYKIIEKYNKTGT